MKRTNMLAALLLTALVAMGQSTETLGKMSPNLQWLVRSEAAAPLHRTPAAGETCRELAVLTKLAPEADEAAVLARYGATLQSRVGRVLVVRLPVDSVAPLAANRQVVRVEAERAPRHMLDQVPAQIAADKAWNGAAHQLPQAYTGQGVVVGIVDSGFDYIHPFFRDGSGKTRISWAADYVKGQKYTTRDAVTATMHSSDAATMYHGTHVAGIAAGSRVEDMDWDKPTVYQGIASEADIAEGAVSADITDGGLSSATSVQAFSDIFAYAEEQGKPCVINYSMGDALSFANSRQLEEEAISTLLQKPGRALVVAAGNSGGTARLAHKAASLTEGGAGVCFNDYEQYGTYFGVELKVRPTQTIRLRYTDSNYATAKGEVSHTAVELAQLTSLTVGTRRLTVQLREQTTDGYNIIYLTAGNTTFATTERMLVTISGDGEAWLYADALCAQLENVAGMAGHQLVVEGNSVCWPASMDEVISVGNVAHRFQIVTMANKYASQGGAVTPTDLTAYESTKGEGYLARSSSIGPTLTGAMKPDVCAPGVNVVSAENFFINDDTYYAVAGWDIAALDTDYETWDGLSGYFHIMAQTGTSMSAPAVAGTIALWMQADPTLTTERIKDIMAHSSRQPDATLSYPNNQYGHGEIDAYRGLLYMLGLTGIKELSQNQPQQAQFHLDGRLLTVSFGNNYNGTATIRIFSTDGRQLLSTTDTTINLSTLPQGVYAVQVSTNQRQTTGSTLIRL